MPGQRSIVILHGPNLNLLGRRVPELYGPEPFAQTVEELRQRFPDTDIAFYQSNYQGQIIDWLHSFGFSCDGIILNAGAFAHTSIAIRDAIEAVPAPVINVHISDIKKRESFRHQDMLAEVCVHNIVGKGRDGYRLAIEQLINSWN